MKIGLLKDTRGAAKNVLSAVKRFQSEGISDIVLVGDFGISNGKRAHAFLLYVDWLLGKHSMTLYVKPGQYTGHDNIKSWTKLEATTGFLEL